MSQSELSALSLSAADARALASSEAEGFCAQLREQLIGSSPAQGVTAFTETHAQMEKQLKARRDQASARAPALTAPPGSASFVSRHVYEHSVLAMRLRLFLLLGGVLASLVLIMFAIMNKY